MKKIFTFLAAMILAVTQVHADSSDITLNITNIPSSYDGWKAFMFGTSISVIDSDVIPYLNKDINTDYSWNYYNVSSFKDFYAKAASEIPTYTISNSSVSVSGENLISTTNISMAILILKDGFACGSEYELYSTPILHSSDGTYSVDMTNMTLLTSGKLMRDYLCFTAEEAGAVVDFRIYNNIPTRPSLQYSTDGQTWTDYSFTYYQGDKITLENVGDKVYFKAKSTNDTFSTYSEGSAKYIYFESTAKVAASGNVMSLIDETCTSTTVPAYCFYELFGKCTNLTSAPQLPATTLGTYCYSIMFEGCTSLTQAPELPATTLADGC